MSKLLVYSNMTSLLRPCIPNFKPNIRVGFWVGTSFSQLPKFNFNVIFHNFQKVPIRTNSEFSINSECLETPVFDPKTGVSEFSYNFLTQKQGFLTQKQEIISELISKLFLRNFCEFDKFGFFRKNSELKKPNISEKYEKYEIWIWKYSYIHKWKVRKFPSNTGP